jgi:iron complex outermembrane receptor protein
MIIKKNKSNLFNPVSLVFVLLMTDTCMAAEELNNKKPPTKNAKESASVSQTPDALELKAITVVGEAENDPNDPYNKSYTVTNSFSATKTDTPIFDTPASIQVVPRAVMNDQKTTTIQGAVENVSSVRPQSTLGASNAFIIRGFRNGRVYRNGLVANGLSVGERTQFDTANLERVEVLKGPAAVLFGRIEPGGLINLVTKKPRDESYYSVEQRFGSYDFYRTEWDATGAITDDKSLSYRFDGSYQNNKSFRDFNFNDRVLVNPSLTWRPGDATEMSLEVEALHEDFQADRGLFAIGQSPRAYSHYPLLHRPQRSR